MNGEARQLRELASRLEQVCRESDVASMAWDQVRVLCDYLCLRARVMELEGARLSEEPHQDYGD
jgi:HPt (histidine-containing phosphotransfer) domain-containing protein